MNKGIYIATLESNSGKSLVSIGLMQNILGQTAKVAYFRPIIEENTASGKDNHIETVQSYFKLNQEYDTAYAYTRSEVIQMRNENRMGDLLDHVIEKYKYLEANYDFVLVEGSDFSGEGSVFEFDFNVLISKNLGLPAILVSAGTNKSLDDFIGSLQLAYQSFRDEEVEILAVIANKIAEENIEVVQDNLKSFLPAQVGQYVIPMVDTLAQPTVREICNVLGGKVLIGEEYMMNRSGAFAVGAMQLRNFLTHLKDNCLVVTPGDRADIILASLQANISTNHPKIAGIILTGGLVPEQSIAQVIKGLPQVVPIISVEEGTFSITNQVGKIQSNITPENEDKITTSISTFQQYVPVHDIVTKIADFQNQVVTPRMFQYSLIQRAKKEKKRIVLPEGTDSRILTASARLANLDLVDIILLGEENKIEQKISQLGIQLDVNKVKIINPVTSPQFDDYVSTFYELRKHKNVNMDIARDWMSDVSYYGTMMIYKGDADGMVSGAVHTTQHTIRPALQFIKTKPGVSVVSSIFFMCLPDRVSVFGDCAINPNPNAEQLAEIAITSADSCINFGIDPRIAMLSYSSGTSGKGEDVDRVREATKLVQAKRPELKIEGPIQYDAAVDLSVGKTKLPDSEVAGQANLLIFPDLNTGNNTYKAVQRETGAIAIGPMLQGLNKPVNDLSRGCTVDDVFNTVIITAIQAQDF